MSREDQCDGEYWFCSLKRPVLASRSFVICVLRQRSSDQNDHWRKESYNETRLQNPQSCSWLVVRQDELWPKDPNQIHWHQKTNSLTFWPKEISHVMNGIICWICLTSAILALLLASQRWQNELKKNQEKNVSQQNRDLWWILLPGRRRSYRLQLQWARGRDITEVKIHGN